MSEPYQIKHLGVAEDYEYSSTHKRKRLSLWSGAFASVYEGEAYSLPKNNGYMVTLSGGDKVRVECELRDDHNYRAVDSAIEDAINEHYRRTGSYITID